MTALKTWAICGLGAIGVLAWAGVEAWVRWAW